MNFTVKCLFEPEILGITWIPGELILVGARPECGKSRYVLGNCIVAGTKGLIPVAYFVPNGSTYKISKTMMEMIVGGSAGNNEKDLPNNMPEYPLYIDCSPHLTIEYLVERIFHMVKEHGVKMVAIDTLQDVDGGVFSANTREKEMTFILRILKNLAEALDLVVIVTSQLSENVQWSNQTPQIKDILYVPFAENLCDQIVLIKSMAVLEDAYQLVLPKGFTIFDGEYGEMIINTVLDKEMRPAAGLRHADDAGGSRQHRHSHVRKHAVGDDRRAVQHHDAPGLARTGVKRRVLHPETSANRAALRDRVVAMRTAGLEVATGNDRIVCASFDSAAANGRTVGCSHAARALAVAVDELAVADFES